MPQSSTHPAPVATADQLYRNRVGYVKSEFTPCWSDLAAARAVMLQRDVGRRHSRSSGGGGPACKRPQQTTVARNTLPRFHVLAATRCGRKKKKELFVDEDLRWSCCSENGGCSRSKWGHQHHQQLQQDGGQSVAK